MTSTFLSDLKQRGLLEESPLIVWGGEFGRTPMMEANRVKGFLWAGSHGRPLRWDAGRRQIKKGLLSGEEQMKIAIRIEGQGVHVPMMYRHNLKPIGTGTMKG